MPDGTDILCAALALLTIVGAVTVILSPLLVLLWMQKREAAPRPKVGAAFPVIFHEQPKQNGETGPQGFEP